MVGRLMTARQLAELLGISLPRTYVLAQGGVLPVVRVGRGVRFDRVAVERWLENGGRGFPGHSRVA